MVRKTKSTESTTTTTTTPTVTVTVEAVPAAAAAAAAPAEKKQRKPKAVAVTPVVEAPVAAPAEEQVAAADASTLSSKLSDFSSKIQQVTSILSTMKTDYKVLEKSVSRELKNASKSKRSKKAPNPNRQPSGFVKPSVISDELIKFLGKETGTMMSRVEVSKEINAYITANQLKDKVSGRQINPDAKLAKLLKVGKDEVLTYFNLQRYLNAHFIKAVAPASEAASAKPTPAKKAVFKRVPSRAKWGPNDVRRKFFTENANSEKYYYMPIGDVPQHPHRKTLVPLGTFLGFLNYRGQVITSDDQYYNDDYHSYWMRFSNYPYNSTEHWTGTIGRDINPLVYTEEPPAPESIPLNYYDYMLSRYGAANFIAKKTILHI